MRKKMVFAVLGALAVMASVHAAEVPKDLLLYTRKSGEQYRIHVMEGDGKNDRELPGQTAKVNLFGVWSPDGKRIVYMSGESRDGPRHTVTISHADGSRPRLVKAPGERHGMAVWSPDGKQIALIAGNDANPAIFVGDAEGNNLHQVSSKGSGAMFPFWTADSSRICYTRFTPPEAKSDLVSSKTDGSDLTTLVKSQEVLFAGSGTVSPDGKRFLYTRLDPIAQKAALYLRSFADGAETKMTDIALPPEDFTLDAFPFACWATDGKTFFVSLPGPKRIGLYRFNADGTGKSRLTPEGVDCFGPSLHSALVE